MVEASLPSSFLGDVSFAPLVPFGAIALLGLAGSAHCGFMCGPMACSVGGCAKGSLGYQAGRLSAYGAAGACAGILGQSALVAGLAPVAGLLTLLAGLAACVLGARRLFMAPSFSTSSVTFGPGAVRTRKPSRIRPSRMASTLERALSASPLPRPFTLGLVTAVFPCALLHAALAQAAAFVSPGPAAAAMLVFGFATTPATWGGARVSSWLARSDRFGARRAAGALFLVSGLLLAIQALRGPDLVHCLGIVGP